MSRAELVPRVYNELRMFVAARMRHEAARQPRVNIDFAGKSNSLQPASVGTTAARNAVSPI
jgi:hypothetical protein